MRRTLPRILMAAALLLAGERPAATQDPAKDAGHSSSAWRDETVKKILEGARAEVANGTVYYLENRYLVTRYLDGKKQKKKVYPWGDIPPDIGVCTDLVIRALRLIYRRCYKRAGRDLRVARAQILAMRREGKA